MRRLIKRTIFTLVGLSVAGIVAVVAVLVYQGKRAPTGTPDYVALGSSYAAGLGLGERAPGSPIACQRSVNGYPQRLARLAGLPLVDMSCSGSTADQILRGGQFFQGPQISAISPTTRLVTLTTGGNDIAYVGDMVMMGYRNRGGLIGRIVGWTMHAPHAPSERNFGKVGSDIEATIAAIHAHAPSARIVIATYPTVLPEHGTCAELSLTAEQVAMMRPVAIQLADITRSAARAGGALVADMATIGASHDACSTVPWINGLAPEHGAPLHPTQAGAIATAQVVARIAGLHPGR